MSAMLRNPRSAVLLAAILPFVSLALTSRAQGQDVRQYLRDQYQGKTLVLRGFPAGNALRYDSSGASDSATPGDWTTDGFVQVTDIHLSHDRLVIKAQRMVAARLNDQFDLRPLERTKGSILRKEPVRLEIKADIGMHNPSREQIEGVASKIFLTSRDSLANLVPDYWRPCVRAGLKGTDKNCVFAAEVLSIPGVASGSDDSSESAAVSGELNSRSEVIPPEGGPLRPGKGVSPPRLGYHHEPEFSEPARVAKFQGTVLLQLVVSKEGTPTNIRIERPLGYGLDAKAVEAVRSWTFSPAEKDGVPVNVAIAVEVSFHLY
jgi:TonB family protein